MNRTAIIIVAGAVLVLACVNAAIVRTERRIANGCTIYLEHAPVDPRSLMQGDYMILNYKINSEDALRGGLDDRPARGLLVLKIDDRNIATFARIDDGTPLAPGEARLRYRRRAWGVATAPESFFFQEGHAELYQGARYSELRLSADGVASLVALADKDLVPLGATD